MTSAQPSLSRVIGAIALSLAIAAAPAHAGGYLKLGDIKGESTAQGRGGQIEIESWSWGETRAGGNVEYEWKVEEGEKSAEGKLHVRKASGSQPPASGGDPDRPIVTGSAANPAPQSREHDKRTTWVEWQKKESGEKGGTEDINIGVGELQEVTISKQMDKSSPMLMQKLAKPLPQGSLRVKTKMPWFACRVGARYPSLELSDGTTDYRLTNAVVAECADASDRPVEEISFNYTKVEVRGWDPKKKEE